MQHGLCCPIQVDAEGQMVNKSLIHADFSDFNTLKVGTDQIKNNLNTYQDRSSSGT